MLISGEAIVEKCKWNIDSRYPIRVWSLVPNTGDRIFMKVSDISTFIGMAPTALLDVVVHNSDEPFTEELYNKLKPFARNIYAVNRVTSGAIPIPLGFRDHQYTSHHVITSVLKEPTRPKDIKCLVNFLIATNPPARQKAFDHFKSNSECLVQDYITYDPQKSFAFKSPETAQKRVDFYRTLKRCEFAICPPGTGLDTHRVYECILFGVVPIVLTSQLDGLYRQFPIWIVRDWSEVGDFTGCPVVPSSSSVTNFKLPWE
jgi:hypothetical protein